MAKEVPRYRAIKAYEDEFKSEYAKIIGSALMEITKELKKEKNNATKHDKDSGTL